MLVVRTIVGALVVRTVDGVSVVRTVVGVFVVVGFAEVNWAGEDVGRRLWEREQPGERVHTREWVNPAGLEKEKCPAATELTGIETEPSEETEAEP